MRYCLAWTHATVLPHSVYYLDYGCGSGYGTELLATQFQHTFGIERDDQARMYAQNMHRRSRAMYFPSLEATGLKNPRFDFITCIEVLEHLDREEGHALLKSFAGMLTEGGSLVLTTPQATSAKPENPYHKHEYTMEELEAYLSTLFETVEVQDISMGIPNMIAVCLRPKHGQEAKA